MCSPHRSWLISQQRVIPQHGALPKPRTSLIPAWKVGSKTVSAPQDDTGIIIGQREIRVQQMEHKPCRGPGRGRALGAVLRAAGREDWSHDVEMLRDLCPYESCIGEAVVEHLQTSNNQ